MAQPLTYSINIPGNYVSVSRQQQRKPFINPLGYRATFAKAFQNGNPVKDGGVALFLINHSSMETYKARAYAIAYDRFVQAVRGDATAQLAVNALEASESASMITKRAKELVSIINDLRRGRVGDALKTAGFIKKPNHFYRRTQHGKKTRVVRYSRHKVDSDSAAARNGSKTAASLWLEYWLGWAPLVGDIGNSIEHLVRPLPNFLGNRVRGAGSVASKQTTSNARPWYQGGQVLESSVRNIDVRVGISARVSIKNKTIANMNLLGLINPATVIYEAIPLSFVLNWFLPIQRFLESYTDLYGFSVLRLSVSYKIVTFASDASVLTWYPSQSESSKSEATQFIRLAPGSLQIPKFGDRAGNGISNFTRAATAISLLVGKLKS